MSISGRATENEKKIKVYEKRIKQLEGALIHLLAHRTNLNGHQFGNTLVFNLDEIGHLQQRYALDVSWAQDIEHGYPQDHVNWGKPALSPVPGSQRIEIKLRSRLLHEQPENEQFWEQNIIVDPQCFTGLRIVQLALLRDMYSHETKKDPNNVTWEEVRKFFNLNVVEKTHEEEDAELHERLK